MMYSKREAYLERVLKVNNEKYLKVMDKYPIDWWDSDDLACVAKFQMNEPTLLVPFTKLQSAVDFVFNHGKEPEERRVIKPEEIRFNNLELRNEVFAAIAAMA